MVFVLSASNKKLMPTTEYRVRRLIKSGKATIYKHRPFTIKLTTAFDAYGTIGRGTDGNFVTSVADDNRLCFDNDKSKDSATIANVKGVGEHTYDSGKYQYEYDSELVRSCNDLGLLQTPNGDTGGASSLNIPGCKTWAGETIQNSESELMMPSIVCDGFDSDKVFEDISTNGYFEIHNPTVLTPDGNEVQVNGCFRIKELD